MCTLEPSHSTVLYQNATTFKQYNVWVPLFETMNDWTTIFYIEFMKTAPGLLRVHMYWTWSLCICEHPKIQFNFSIKYIFNMMCILDNCISNFMNVSRAFYIYIYLRCTFQMQFNFDWMCCVTLLIDEGMFNVTVFRQQWLQRAIDIETKREKEREAPNSSIWLDCRTAAATVIDKLQTQS